MTETVAAKVAEDEEIEDYSNYTPTDAKVSEAVAEETEPLVDEDKLYDEK